MGEPSFLPHAKPENDRAVFARLQAGTLIVDGDKNRVFSTLAEGGKPCLPRPLVVKPDRCGYLRFRIRVPGGSHNRVTICLHRAVWMQVHGRLIPTGHDVDHIDNDPTNNAPENLRPLTRQENLARRYQPAVAGEGGAWA